MLKAEDLDHQQQKHQSDSPVNMEAAVMVESVTADFPDQDRSGPQSPPSYAQSSPKQQQQHHHHQQQQQQHRRRLKFDMSSKIQIVPDNRQGQLNTAFLATIPGVLKIAEIALSFVSFILAICADRNATTAAWTENISFAAAIIVSGLLIGYVCFPHLTIKDEQTREGLIVAELIFYGVSTLLFFIAIWLMVHLSASWVIYGRGSAIIDAIICVALTILFGIDTLAKLKAWRGENEPSSRIIQTARPMMEPNRKYEPNAELRRNTESEMA